MDSKSCVIVSGRVPRTKGPATVKLRAKDEEFGCDQSVNAYSLRKTEPAAISGVMDRS